MELFRKLLLLVASITICFGRHYAGHHHHHGYHHTSAHNNFMFDVDNDVNGMSLLQRPTNISVEFTPSQVHFDSNSFNSSTCIFYFLILSFPYFLFTTYLFLKLMCYRH